MRNLLFDGIPHTEFKNLKAFKFGIKYPEKRNSQRRFTDPAACASLSKIFTISNSAPSFS